VLSDLGGDNRSAAGKRFADSPEKMASQWMLRVKTAVPFNCFFINQRYISLIDIVNQKALGMAEMLVDFPAIL
jgi:hypothetical protein